ncbi:MAG: hypothetical protein ABL879_15300 [Devosia sp.]
MGRYPRTVSEFAAGRREVQVHCAECMRRRVVPPDVLDAAFGPDFDLYDGYAGLVAELRCDQCGKKHRTIVFRYPARTGFGEVNSEDALNSELERRAYIRVRGWETQELRGPRRRRR